MKFVLGQKVDKEALEKEVGGEVIFAGTPVEPSDVNYEAWRDWYNDGYPNATREEIMRTAWYAGYRARLLFESMRDDAVAANKEPDANSG